MASQGVNIKIADNADLGYSSKSVSPESIQNRQDRSQKDGDFESMETSSMQIQVDSNQNYENHYSENASSAQKTVFDTSDIPDFPEAEEFEDIGEDDQASCSHSSSFLSASGGTELFASCRTNQLRSSIRSNSSCGSSPGKGRRGFSHSANASSVALGHLFNPSRGHSREPSLDSQGITMDDIDGTMSTLEDRASQLEEQLETVKAELRVSLERNKTLKSDSLQLQEKLYQLEEQLKEAESRRLSDIKDEEKRNKECLFKVEKTKNEEIDELLAAQYDLEDENGKLKTQANQTQKLVDTLNADKSKLEERLAQECLKNESLTERHKVDRENFERERINQSHLLDELGKELEELRAYKFEKEREKTVFRTLSVSDLPLSRYDEMEREISQMKRENAKLKSAGEELEAQLLNYSLEEGRRLLRGRNSENDTTSEVSFAAEVETMTKDEMMESLREQREVNGKLREYVDRILLLAIEKNPSILEIEHSKR